MRSGTIALRLKLLRHQNPEARARDGRALPLLHLKDLKETVD